MGGAEQKEFTSIGFTGKEEIIDTRTSTDLLYRSERAKVSKDYLKWYEGFKGEFKPTEIELVGSEQTSYIQRARAGLATPETEIVRGVKGGAELRYPAEPFLAASEGKQASLTERFILKEGGEGYRYISTGEPGEVIIQSTRKGNLLAPSERTAYSEAGILGQKVKTIREFSAVKIWGKMNPKEYSKYLKTNPAVEASARENLLNKGAIKDITTLQKSESLVKETVLSENEAVIKDTLENLGENADVFSGFTEGTTVKVSVSLKDSLKSVYNYIPSKFYEMGAKVTQSRSPYATDAISKRIDANFRASQNAIKNVKQNYYKIKGGSMKPIEGTYNPVTGKYEGYSRGSKTEKIIREGEPPFKQMGGLAASQLENVSIKEIPVYTDIVSIRPLGVQPIKSPIVLIRTSPVETFERRTSQLVNKAQVNAVSPVKVIATPSEKLGLDNWGTVDVQNIVDVGQTPIFKPIEAPVTTPIEQPITIIEERQREQTTAISLPSFPVPKYNLPVAFPWGAGGGGESSRGFGQGGGRFFKLKHKIPLPKELYGQVLGKKRITVLSQVGRKTKSKKKKSKRRKKR